MNGLKPRERHALVAATILAFIATFLPWVSRPFASEDKHYSSDVTVPASYFRDPTSWVPPSVLTDNGWTGLLSLPPLGISVPGLLAMYASFIGGLVTWMRRGSLWDPPRVVAIVFMLFALAYAAAVLMIVRHADGWRVGPGGPILALAVAAQLALALLECRRAATIKGDASRHRVQAFTP